MDIRLIFIMLLTFIIAIIGTLAYSVRIVGVRTRKIAISFSLFNILILFSRVAHTIQTPMLTKYIEQGHSTNIIFVFYSIIICSSVATMVGIIIIPTFQRILGAIVLKFSYERSFYRLLVHGFSKNGIIQFKDTLILPSKNSITQISLKKISLKTVIFNMMAVSLLVAGSLAPVYSGTLEPTLRATCLSLSGIINGLATILSFVFIDPHLSILTDDVLEGKCTEATFRSNVIALLFSKLFGTLISIPILIPASKLIVLIAKLL